MKTTTIFLLNLLFLTITAFTQVSINTDGSDPDPSAGLDIKFSNKGILIPRLTYDQQNAIVNPAEGLMIFCTNCTADGAISIFTNGSWKIISSCNLVSPAEGVHIPSLTQIVWNWSVVAGATGYKWNTIKDYGSAIDMGTLTTKTETGLLPGLNYTRYIWAYSSCGISSVTILTQATLPVPVVCGATFTDPRDNQVYGTVKIGLQCWMSRNLNIGTKIDGAIEQTNNGIIEKYCYNDIETNCNIYGGLYKWDEYMNYTSSSSDIPSGRQGICPVGWHVPSNAEFSQLTAQLGGEGLTGGKLKESGLMHWAEPNAGATNSSGFTALPGGLLLPNRVYYNQFYFTYFWSTTENTSADAWNRGLDFNSTMLSNYCTPKNWGLSARCVQD